MTAPDAASLDSSGAGGRSVSPGWGTAQSAASSSGPGFSPVSSVGKPVLLDGLRAHLRGVTRPGGKDVPDPRAGVVHDSRVGEVLMQVIVELGDAVGRAATPMPAGGVAA
jgi:hypothetical protein